MSYERRDKILIALSSQLTAAYSCYSTPMRILGIETSCDETSAAIVEDGMNVRSCVIASSQKSFENRGGVIPEEAARQQIPLILPVIKEAIEKAACTKEDIDAIAVACAPGLLGSLLVGTTTARVLAHAWNLPLIGVRHTHAHFDSVWLDRQNDPPQFPCLTLSVSGGHSELWLRKNHTEGELLGRTRDDAAGEAFDKGALLFGLPYPGGPILAKMADGGDERAYKFPLPLHDEETCDFSFSGLKTALKYQLRDLGEHAKDETARKNLMASYQYAICRHLAVSVKRAVKLHPDIKEIHLAGGVSANLRLRAMIEEEKGSSVRLLFPSTLTYCTDNAAMIAATGFFLHEEKGERAFIEFVTQPTM